MEHFSACQEEFNLFLSSCTRMKITFSADSLATRTLWVLKHLHLVNVKKNDEKVTNILMNDHWIVNDLFQSMFL